MSENVLRSRLGLVGGSALKLGTGVRRPDEPLVRYAFKDAAQVAKLRCSTVASGHMVECEVQRVDGAGGVSQRGPFVFATEAEARHFADEIALALEYLGCEVSSDEPGETAADAPQVSPL